MGRDPAPADPTAAAPPVWAAYNRSRETSLGSAITRAGSFRTRLLGLHAQGTLPPGGGLWLVPCRGIQTIGMRQAIDAVFLDAGHRVVRVIAHLSPGRVIWRVPRAHSALELPAGTIERSRTQVGDHVELATP